MLARSFQSKYLPGGQKANRLFQTPEFRFLLFGRQFVIRLLIPPFDGWPKVGDDPQIAPIPQLNPDISLLKQ
jgi:hypothetical protein